MTDMPEKEGKRILNPATLSSFADVCLLQHGLMEQTWAESDNERMLFLLCQDTTLSRSFDSPCLGFPRLKMRHLNMTSLSNSSKLMFEESLSVI